ncbi:MAG: lipoyl(octanoyl) transferase LipB [Pseudomonadota bacterium]
MKPARLLNLNRLAYPEALALMRGLVEAKRDPALPETLILTEHEPVMTMGRRAEEKDIPAGREALRARGIGLFRIERGGLVTYHGPGQLVAYPIFRLRALNIGVAEMVRSLEDVIILTLADFGLIGRREPEHPGVWIGARKTASIGLAVRRAVTFHGLALNVNPDLSHFGLINPCGLTGTGITSMSEESGSSPDPALIRTRLAVHFSRIFNLEFQPWSLEEALTLAGNHGTTPAQTTLA